MAAPSASGQPLIWHIYRKNGQEVTVRLAKDKKTIAFADAKLQPVEVQYIKDQIRNEEYYRTQL